MIDTKLKLEDYVVIDIENPNRKADSICQIGIIQVKNNKVVYEKNILINPEDRFDEINMRVNHITPNMVKDAITFDTFWEEIKNIVLNNVIVGHGIKYDISVISKCLKKYRIELPKIKIICTQDLAKKYLPIDKYKLDYICEFLNIELDKHHNALCDAEASMKVFEYIKNNYDINEKDIELYKYQEQNKVANNNNKMNFTDNTKSLQNLKNSIENIMKDNKIENFEITELKLWLDNNKQLIGNYPFDKIYNIVNKVLNDGTISATETNELNVIFNEFINPLSNNEEKSITFNNKLFCLTGTFNNGTKENVEKLIIDNGGECSKTVTLKLDYLIVGGSGSADWKFGNYGSKVQKVMELNEKGKKIQIISEDEFFNKLNSNTTTMQNIEIDTPNNNYSSNNNGFVETINNTDNKDNVEITKDESTTLINNKIFFKYHNLEIKNNKMLLGGQYFSYGTLKTCAKILKILGILIVILGLPLLFVFVGIIFIGLGILLYKLGKEYDEIAEQLKIETNVGNKNIEKEEKLSKDSIMFNKIKHKDIENILNNGNFYRIESSSKIFTFYSNHLEIQKSYINLIDKINYDENTLSEFNLDKVEIEVEGYYNALKLHYFRTNSSPYSTLEIVHFDKTELQNIQQLADYLNKKTILKKKYDIQQKNLREKEENERRYGKNRYSNIKFTFFDDDSFLKYKYYDIEVKGTQYFDFDISKIAIDEDLKFEFDSTNQFDENAIKVLYNNITIGYVPKNNIQKMIKIFIEDDDKYIKAFVSRVNEDLKLIEMAIAFYKELDDNELKNIPHIDATLIKTTKKDEYDMSRQENLFTISEDDVVSIDTQYDSDLYLVTDEYGNELGELSESVSKKILEYEYDYSTYAVIKEMKETSSGNLTAKIRIFFFNDN